jgi:hypothetical protein
VHVLKAANALFPNTWHWGYNNGKPAVLECLTYLLEEAVEGFARSS